MCHQSVGLIQSVIENAGIPTVSITMLREVTERLGPPRALFVDFPLGHPLGLPNDATLQTQVIMAALAMLQESGQAAVIRDFHASR